jgi:hypothetical protein
MIGVGFDGAVKNFASDLPAPPPAPAPVEAKPVVIYLPTAKPSLMLDFDRDKFRPYGYLNILGPAPKGFRDFNYIELSLYRGNNNEYPVDITLVTNDEYASADYALVTERTLYFTTPPSTPDGFQYRFEGEFLVADLTSVSGKDLPAVRGKLTKFKDGRTLAEQTITFTFWIGC